MSRHQGFMLCLAGITTLLCTVCSAAQERPLTRADLAIYKQTAEAAGKAQETRLYEGLPHPSFEGDLLKQELQTKKTITISNHPFYEKLLPIKQEDIASLKKLFTSQKNFQRVPTNVRKMCGGFHPDYCIEWQVEKEKYRCLVCFGCSEVKVYGPKGVYLHAELTEEAAEQMGDILKPYRESRPQPKP